MTPASVSVLLPVYNGERFLREAVESVLSQSFSDLELLVIDDGSTDATPAILSSFSDRRLRAFRNEANLGLIASLNRGIGLCSAPIVARLDADDVCARHRLAQQVRFLEQHPVVGVCGSWVIAERTTEPFTGPAATGASVWRYPVVDADIRCQLLFGAAFAHPSVAMRRSLLLRTGARYDPAFAHAEDYALWTRLAPHTKLHNIPKPLVRYRLHDASVSANHRQAQQAAASAVRAAEVRAVGISPTPQQLRVHDMLGTWHLPPSLAFLNAADQWLCTLLRANRQTRRYPTRAFQRALIGRYYAAARSFALRGFPAWQRYHRARLVRRSPLARLRGLKLLLRQIACRMRAKPPFAKPATQQDAEPSPAATSMRLANRQDRSI